MKKVFFGLIALASMTLASCSTDTKDSTATQSYVVATLVTDNSAEGRPSFVAGATYTVYMNWSQWKGSVSTKNQPLKDEAGNINTLVCDTTTLIYNQAGSPEQGYGDILMLKNMKGEMNGDKSLSLAPNAKFVATSLFYRYNGSIAGIESMQNNQAAVLLNLHVGDYQINSIPLDALYLGSTNTTTPMAGSAPYTNKDIGYRIKLNVKDKKAMFVIYQAQFAEQMPKLEAIVLKDLPVVFQNGSYSITASDVVPQMPEGGKLIDNDKFTFENLKIRIGGELLNEATINFDIKGGFKGYFSGSYVEPNALKEGGAQM